MRRCLFRLGLVFCTLLLGTGVVRGQSMVALEGGVRAVALGGAATALPGDVWGFSNPAACATLKERAVSFFASQSFGLAALRLGAVHYVEPVSFGAFAAGARTFGFEDFRESHFDAGFARGFRLGTSRRLYAGVNLRYHRVRLGGSYGSAGALGLSLGVLVAMLPRLHLGFHATNVNNPSWTRGEDLPQTLAVGLSYAPGPRVTVLLDAFKDLDYPISVRAGIELWPINKLALRAGVTTQPTRFTVGVGVRLDRLRAGVAAARHQALGWSPAAGLSVTW